MTYSSPNTTNDFVDEGVRTPTDSELAGMQKEYLIKLWIYCYVLGHRLYGPNHQCISDLNTIRTNFTAGVITALEAQEQCFDQMETLGTYSKAQVDSGNWDILSKYRLQSNLPELISLSGVTEGVTNLGSFSGSTIPDGRTIKQAIQALETALESAGGGTAPPVLIPVFNSSGVPLDRGTPVYISGTYATGVPLVSKADANGSNTYPAVGLTSEVIGTGTSGYVVISGILGSLDTDTPGWNPGDALYLDESAGDLTSTRPTGSNTKVQKVAVVTRRDQTAGSVIVTGAGRTNDVPNELTALLGTGLYDINLGTFTGSTIGDNLSVKGALQQVETAVETNITQAALLTALGVGSYADDAAAGAAGLAIGDVYYNTSDDKLTTR